MDSLSCWLQIMLQGSKYMSIPLFPFTIMRWGSFAYSLPLTFNCKLTPMAKLQNTYEQSCAYCHQDFIPVKRGTQRFCSGSCRTTHCKKKKAGTLGRVTKLKGPRGGMQRGSFAETALASATGALAANTLTQTAEYYVVTKGLVKQMEELARMVTQLSKTQSNTYNLVGKGLVAILKQSGLSREEAFERLGIPLTAPAAKPTQKKQLPAPTAFDMAAFDAALAKALSPEELTKPAFEKGSTRHKRMPAS